MTLYKGVHYDYDILIPFDITDDDEPENKMSIRGAARAAGRGARRAGRSAANADLLPNGKRRRPGARYVINMSPYWKARGYNLYDEVGKPTGVKPEHVERAKVRVTRARTSLARTSVAEVGNRRSAKARGWKLVRGGEGEDRYLKHDSGIVYAWETDIYAQKPGGRVRKFDSVDAAMEFIESPTPPRKRANPPAPAPRHAAKKATTAVKRTTTATRAPGAVKRASKKTAAKTPAKSTGTTRATPAKTAPRAQTWTRGSGQGVMSWSHPTLGMVTRDVNDRHERPYKTSDGRRWRTLGEAKAHLTEKRRRATKAVGTRSQPRAAAAKAAVKTPRKAAAPSTPRKATQAAPSAAGAPQKRTGAAKTPSTAGPGSAIARRGGSDVGSTRAGTQSDVEYLEPETNLIEGEVVGRGGVPARREQGVVPRPEAQPPAGIYMQEGEAPVADWEYVPPMLPKMTFEQWSRIFAHREPFSRMSARALRLEWARQMGEELSREQRHPSAVQNVGPIRPEPPSDPRGVRGVIEANNRVIEDLQQQFDELSRSPRVNGGPLNATYRAMRARMMENRISARGMEVARGAQQPKEPWMTEQYWIDRIRALDELAASIDMRPIGNRARGQGGVKSFAEQYLSRMHALVTFSPATLVEEFKRYAEGAEFKGEQKHSGVMVALIPRDDDALRLEIPGYERKGELHTTLMFLGDADKYDGYQKERIVNAVRLAAMGLRMVRGKAFAASMFNPTGEDPCVVLGVSGKELAKAHVAIRESVIDNVLLAPPPNEHQPWVPHITLAYTDRKDYETLRQAMERANGQDITYDRVRVAFGDDNAIDIELSGYRPPDLDTRLDSMIAGDTSRTQSQTNDEWVEGGRLNAPRVGAGDEHESFGGYFVPNR